MYNSLTSNFTLHYLCLDDETYKTMWSLPNVKAYRYDEIKDLPDLKVHRESHTWEQHCWCLASYFMNWLQERESFDSLLYVDADIMFYADYELIYEEVGDRSIGIITHRFLEERARKTGNYNVGVIYFRGDEPGRTCLKWWRDVVIDDNNDWFCTHGTCGDQKYLELFEVMWDGMVAVIDDHVGHAAPWNCHVQECDGKTIWWRGIEQPLVFYHFSHFSYDDKGYRTNRHGEWTPEVDQEWARKLYDEYYKLIQL